MRIRIPPVLLALFVTTACAGGPSPVAPRDAAPPPPPASAPAPAAAPKTAPAPLSAQERLSMAAEALARRQEETALRNYREALSLLPAGDARRAPAAQHVARLLTEAGRHKEAAEFLAAPPGSEVPEAHRLRALSLEAQGRDREAVGAYVEAEAQADATARDEVAARTRALIDRMKEPDLSELSRLRPYSRHGAYAGLRLALLDAQRGRPERSASALRRLAFLFPDDPVGKAAREALPVDAPAPPPTVSAPRAPAPQPRGAAPAIALLPAGGPAKSGVYGLLLPLSGPLAPLGEKVLRGALLGFSLLSPGPRDAFTVLVADTRGDPAVAAKEVETLTRRGALGILGPLKGDEAAAAATAARGLGVPLLTPTPAENVAGAGVFRLTMREEDEVDALARYAVETLGIRRFAVLHPDTEAGRRYRNLFWDAAVRRGAEIAGSESFAEVDTRALETPIRRLSGTYNLSRADLKERYQSEQLLDPLAPEPPKDVLDKYKPRPVVDFGAVFVPAPSLAAAQLAPLFPYYDVTGVRLLGLRSWNYAGLVQVGKQYVEGAIFPAEWSPATPEGQEFQRAYLAAYGEAPGALEAFGYDAAALLRDLQRQGLSDSRERLSRALSRIGGVAAVTGPLTGTPTGDIAATPKLLTVERQQIVPAPREVRP